LASFALGAGPVAWFPVGAGAVGSLLLGAATPSASARAFLPPRGKVFQGVAGQPISQYEDATGRHPSVYQEFLAWGEYVPAITTAAWDVRSRLMIMIGTRSASRELITPAGIAYGQGDSWLISLQRSIAASRLVTYVRLMAEMDGYWNPFSAYNANGSSRGAAHSSAAYKQAWRRVTLIMRGGSLGHIDATLRRLRMPPLRTHASLPRARVAMLWVPQVAPGDPDIPGNEPSDYFPGRGWVDWVGTDFYSSAPNFTGLDAFYNTYPGLPFVFGEYAVGETPDDPGFIDAVFRWAGAHPRVRMMMYNMGVSASGPFRLFRFPQSSRALRHALANPKFVSFAPEFRR
jgi:hypothetical protein